MRKFLPHKLAGAARPTPELLASTEKWWQSWWAQGASVRLPDHEAEDLYYASLAYLLILRQQVGDYFLVTPGPEGYHTFWYRDGVLSSRARLM